MRHRTVTSLVTAFAVLLFVPGLASAAERKPESPSIDKLKPTAPATPKPNEVKLPTAPPPRVEPKPPLGAELNTTDKSVTVPLTRDGNVRFGVQDRSKDPTRENPQGERGGAAIIQRRFP